MSNVIIFCVIDFTERQRSCNPSLLFSPREIHSTYVALLDCIIHRAVVIFVLNYIYVMLASNYRNGGFTHLQSYKLIIVIITYNNCYNIVIDSPKKTIAPRKSIMVTPSRLREYRQIHYLMKPDVSCCCHRNNSEGGSFCVSLLSQL